jgi:hypothetical protein
MGFLAKEFSITLNTPAWVVKRYAEFQKKCLHLFMLAAPIKKIGVISYETQHNIKPYYLKEKIFCRVSKKCAVQ